MAGAHMKQKTNPRSSWAKDASLRKIVRDTLLELRRVWLVAKASANKKRKIMLMDIGAHLNARVGF